MSSRSVKKALKKGFADGVASAFTVRGTRRPAPPLMRRRLGSLHEDARALERDAARLLRGPRSS